MMSFHETLCAARTHLTFASEKWRKSVQHFLIVRSLLLRGGICLLECFCVAVKTLLCSHTYCNEFHAVESLCLQL